MNKTMYYGEMCAKISGELLSDPLYSESIEAFMDRVEAQHGDTLWSLCANAASVFELIEEKCDIYFVDWQAVINQYCQYIKDQLLSQKMPETSELFLLTVKSIHAVKHSDS